MLDDRDCGGFAKGRGDFDRAVDVGHVVKASFAFEGFEVVGKKVVKLVQRAFLVRVFAVAGVECFGADDELLGAKTAVETLVHVVGDHRIVRARVLERLDHQTTAEL